MCWTSHGLLSSFRGIVDGDAISSQAARAKARAERARAAAAESERVRQECAELRSRVASAHKGKDRAEVEAA
eukprot:5720518-Pleurochrysis_carterae.AAC.1